MQIVPRGGKRFSKDYQPDNRNKRGPGWRKIILEELEKEGVSENEFVKKLLTIALNPRPEERNLSLPVLIELIHRLSPPEKNQFRYVEFDFDANATPVQKIDSVLKRVSMGQIAPDVAAVVVDMIKSGVEVFEATELAERMERIEELLKGGD